MLQFVIGNTLYFNKNKSAIRTPFKGFCKCHQLQNNYVYNIRLPLLPFIVVDHDILYTNTP
jgi:hypothetical protein